MYLPVLRGNTPQSHLYFGLRSSKREAISPPSQALCAIPTAVDPRTMGFVSQPTEDHFLSFKSLLSGLPLAV